MYQLSYCYRSLLTIIPHHIPSETWPNGETSTISAIWNGHRSVLKLQFLRCKRKFGCSALFGYESSYSHSSQSVKLRTQFVWFPVSHWVWNYSSCTSSVKEYWLQPLEVPLVAFRFQLDVCSFCRTVVDSPSLKQKPYRKINSPNLQILFFIKFVRQFKEKKYEVNRVFSKCPKSSKLAFLNNFNVNNF